MKTVTIIEDEPIYASVVADKVNRISNIETKTIFDDPTQFKCEFLSGYQSDIYLLDCLWRGDRERNFGFELATLITEVQSSAIIIIMTQLEVESVIHGLNGSPVHAIIDKHDPHNFDVELLKASQGLLKPITYQTDSPKKSSPIADLQTIISVHDQFSLRETTVYHAILMTWNIDRAALYSNLSQSIIRKTQDSISLSLNFDKEKSFINSLWRDARKNDFWSIAAFGEEHIFRDKVALLESLPATTIKVLLLFSEGYSVSQIAIKLSTPGSSISRRMTTLRATLNSIYDVELWEAAEIIKRKDQ